MLGIELPWNATGGALHSGELTGVLRLLPLSVHEAAATTYFFTWERPWRGAMKPWKLSDAQQQASWNSRASWSGPKRVRKHSR
jgi:hypothetical protein